MPSLSYISPKATVQDSPIHGRGLFAIAPIAKGEIVCIKGGYIITREVLSTMPEWYGGEHSVILTFPVIAVDNAQTLDRVCRYI